MPTSCRIGSVPSFFATPAQPAVGGWNLDSSYARLPEVLHRPDAPQPVREPRLIIFQEELARSLGLDPVICQDPAMVGWWTGNKLPPGARPLTQAYAGHQFGYQTMLGDGRAHLLGEQIAPDGTRWDVQLKGSGRSGFSRRGDGRAAVGPMLREFLISEAMHGLGIPTTRSLAVATTGETVYREDPLPGAVLTRIAASHIRVGTFEYASAVGGRELVAILVDYTLARHFPDAEAVGHPALTLLHAVMAKQASLLAQWMGVGFVHGVMNTDNMALSGETIDYGPCAFLDRYDPATVFSSIDHHGRYAYNQQPHIALWNLTRLAESLLPCWGENKEQAIAELEEMLHRFADLYQTEWIKVWRAKLGLGAGQPEDQTLIEAFLKTMEETSADFTWTCRNLARWAVEGASVPAAWQDWRTRWLHRLHAEEADLVTLPDRLRAQNPARIPRNHVVDEALHTASSSGDLQPVLDLWQGLRDPYTESEQWPGLSSPPPPDAPRHVTFCGT